MKEFEALYRQSAPKVYRFLLRLSQNAELAEELTEETFYQALLHLDRFEGRCEIDSWLCQIAKNTYYKEQRRRSRRASPEALEEMAAPNLLLKLEERETALAVHRLLHELAEPYREVFTLHIFGELTFREIAGIFGKSESWAKMTFYRAKARLIQQWEAQYGKQDENG